CDATLKVLSQANTLNGVVNSKHKNTVINLFIAPHSYYFCLLLQQYKPAFVF
ncbi:hypothetical protein LCGC14_2547290, partial [marine sediment metagenome]